MQVGTVIGGNVGACPYHRDTTLVARFVMSETTGEVSGLQKVVHEGGKDLVERILAVSPVALPLSPWIRSARR